jgi:MYXO-CTERM domain-containing protein
VRFLALALLAVLAPLPFADAHGGGEFPHVNPFPVRLGPGEAQFLELTFEENMTKAAEGNHSFEAGWVFVLSAFLTSDSAPVQVALHPGHNLSRGPAVANWTLASHGTQVVTAGMPVTDVYTLELRHGGGPGRTNMTFFYDQSCECAGKPIPLEVPNGAVLFNVDVKQGQTWKATFPEPPAYDLSIVLAERTNPLSRWPQDFSVLGRSDQPVVRDVGAGPVRLHELGWTAQHDGAYYFLATAIGVHPERVDRTDMDRFLSSLYITPFYEQVGSAPKAAPAGPELALGALALAALAAVARRR